jgi:putative lipase involved disintegration of autophagic bodies
MSVNLYDVLKSGYGDKKYQKKLHDLGYKKDSLISNRNNHIYVNEAEKKIIHNVKGTNPFSFDDVKTDVLLALGKLKDTDRYNDSKRVLILAKDKYQGFDTSIAGHSLGGRVAQLIGSKNDKVVSYNAGYTAFQPTRTKGGNHLHYRTEGDLVSALSGNSKNITTLKNNNFNTGNLIYDSLKAHDLENIKSSNIRL